MDTKTKLLFWFVIMVTVISVSASYYRFMVLHDYIVEAQVDCDPSIESCFVWECDPLIDGSDVCTGNPEEDTWYYKYAYRNAKNTGSCEDGDTTCQFTCPVGGEEECEEVLCSNDTRVTYNTENECTNPDDFQNEIIDDTEGEEGTNEEELVADTEPSDEQADTTEEIE